MILYEVLYSAVDDHEIMLLVKTILQHTVPQHRQYLNYDGVGSGTPFEREKQHIKYKRAKAAENVMDYRVQKVSRSSGEHESALTKDTRASKKIKTG